MTITVHINGRAVEWTPCKRHVHYVLSGHVVLSCKDCVLHRVPKPEQETAPAINGVTS
jgi:hypothetical protein